MKQLKDYLHFYKDVLVKVKKMYDNDYHVGRVCEISSKSNHGDWVIVWFDNVITVTNNTHNQLSSNAHHYFFGEDDIKPILRPLSDMTEEEFVEIERWGIYQGKTTVTFALTCAECTAWMIRQNFDVFNLIKDGLAIDKTTYNTQQV